MFDEMFQFASVNRVGDFNLNFRASTIFFPDQWQRGMRIKKTRGRIRGPLSFHLRRTLQSFNQQSESIAIVLWLVRAIHRHANVIRLVLAELGQLCTQLAKVQSCHLLIKRLGK